MKDEDSLKGLVHERTLCGRADLSPEALEVYEKAGYAKWEKMASGIRYYSEKTVEILKAMTLCQGQCSDLAEAYEMALRAVALKTGRDEQTSKIGQTDHQGTMDPNDMKTHATFEDLLPIDEDTLEEIGRKMALYGYYESQPILLGKWAGLDYWVVIDGHTRRLAAIKLGIKKVFYVTREFDSESAALEHAMSLQTDRRITEDRHILQFVERYDSVAKRGGDRRSEAVKSKPTPVGIETGRSASARRIASMMGTAVNYKKVEKARKVLKDGSATTQKAVRQGKLTINKAYNVTVDKGKGTKKVSLKKAKAAMELLTDENRAAFEELGGDFHYHLNKAAEWYIRELRKNELFLETTLSDAADDEEKS